MAPETLRLQNPGLIVARVPLGSGQCHGDGQPAANGLSTSTSEFRAPQKAPHMFVWTDQEGDMFSDRSRWLDLAGVFWVRKAGTTFWPRVMPHLVYFWVTDSWYTNTVVACLIQTWGAAFWVRTRSSNPQTEGISQFRVHQSRKYQDWNSDNMRALKRRCYCLVTSVLMEGADKSMFFPCLGLPKGASPDEPSLCNNHSPFCKDLGFAMDYFQTEPCSMNIHELLGSLVSFVVISSLLTFVCSTFFADDHPQWPSSFEGHR